MAASTPAEIPPGGAGPAAWAAITALFERQGCSDYVGEPVNQLEHALQAAKCARDAGATDGVVLGALLHDVGHMLGLDDREAHTWMGDCGCMNHEGLGAAWLSSLGLPQEVCAIVSGHVNAKRYLCWKNPGYYAKLSDASRVTLGYQGGPMGDTEAAAFELDPTSSTILKMRTWDEAAKVQGMTVPPLGDYRDTLVAMVEAEMRRRAAQ